MTQTDRQEAGCRCRRVRFSVTGRPLVTMACHCDGCQKMTASAFSVSALFHQSAFAVTQGETVLGGLRGEVQHHFCGSCFSWMFTRADFLGDLVNIRSILLDPPQAEALFIKCWTEAALPWDAHRRPSQVSAVPRFRRLPTADGRLRGRGKRAAALIMPRQHRPRRPAAGFVDTKIGS